MKTGKFPKQSFRDTYRKNTKNYTLFKIIIVSNEHEI